MILSTLQRRLFIKELIKILMEPEFEKTETESFSIKDVEASEVALKKISEEELASS